MKKHQMPRQGNIRMLTDEEARTISGGSIVGLLLRFAKWGAVYFFNMGVTEGRKMRATL